MFGGRLDDFVGQVNERRRIDVPRLPFRDSLQGPFAGFGVLRPDQVAIANILDGEWPVLGSHQRTGRKAGQRENFTA